MYCCYVDFLLIVFFWLILVRCGCLLNLSFTSYGYDILLLFYLFVGVGLCCFGFMLLMFGGFVLELRVRCSFFLFGGAGSEPMLSRC
jgi:hypothetical protein